jgi:ethanolamine ammonia-lyase small subunit
MSAQDDALAYMGLSNLVDLSSQSFTVADYNASCGGTLAEYLAALADAVSTCGKLVPLLVGEVPTDGLDTPATIIQGAKCYMAYRTYIEKSKALSNCLSAVDGATASKIASAADTISSSLDQTAQQAQAMVDQQASGEVTQPA